MPNPSRQKGDRFERQSVHDLLALGVPAARVPLSGAAGGEHIDDLEVYVRGEKRRIECKTRKRAWGDLFGWLSRKDRKPPYALFVKADRTETLVVMTLDTFAELAQEQF